MASASNATWSAALAAREVQFRLAGGRIGCDNRERPLERELSPGS
jgi:hypothetical protein